MGTMLRTVTLTGLALACATYPLAAQDKGKTAAAELASESQKALQALVASAPLAKQLEPQALAILVFPKVTKAGLMIGGDRKSTRLNSSHLGNSYAVFCF